MTIRLILICSLLSSSCSSKNSESSKVKEHGFFDQVFEDDAYLSTFEKMTKGDRVYSEFEPVLLAQATFWGKTIREAFAHDYATRFRLSEDEELTLLKENLEENESFFVFLITVETKDRKWNDLDNQKTGLWRVLLEDESASIQIRPDKIEVVSPKDQVSLYYFRMSSPFARTYRVRFAKNPLRSTDKLVLFVTGPRGRVAFRFNLKELGEGLPDKPLVEEPVKSEK